MSKEGENKIVYKELSYKIVGVMFDVYNELGYGHPEKVYEKAIEKAFVISGISYQRQANFNLTYHGEIVGKYYIDFIVDNKIVLELKKDRRFPKRNIEQIKGYLQATNMKLAILANFTPEGVNFLRVLNIPEDQS